MIVYCIWDVYISFIFGFYLTSAAIFNGLPLSIFKVRGSILFRGVQSFHKLFAVYFLKLNCFMFSILSVHDIHIFSHNEYLCILYLYTCFFLNLCKFICYKYIPVYL